MASPPDGCVKRGPVLPGLADCHTHVLLQGDITAEDYDEQLLKESIPYRTIRATMAAAGVLFFFAQRLVYYAGGEA